MYSAAPYDHYTLNISFPPFINYTSPLAKWLRRHNVNREEGCFELRPAGNATYKHYIVFATNNFLSQAR